MSNFISGGAVDCGPSTALKDVSALVERDYGVQRDRYVAQPGSSAGPSAFRRQTSSPQQAALAPNPFDVSQLRSHLPQAPSPMYAPGPAAAVPQSHSPVSAGAAPQRWADSFPASSAAKGKGRATEPATAAWGAEFQQRSTPEPALAPWQRPTQAGYVPPMAAMGPGMMQQRPMMPMYQPPPMVTVPPTTMPAYAPPPVPVQAEPQVQQPQPQQQQQQPQQAPKDRPQDELARTAQALVDQLGQEHGTNDKLHNSQFVQLLRGLGEGSVVVQEGTGVVEEGQEVGDGAKFVAANGGGDWASAFLDNNTTTGATTGMSSPNYETHPSSMFDMGQDAWAEQFQTALTMNDSASRNKSVHFDAGASETMRGSTMPRDLNEALQHQTAKPGASSMWEEDLEDDDDFDTEALRQFNGPKVLQPEPEGVTQAQHEGWDELQQWSDDAAYGYREEPYLFHSANPYTLGSPIVRELSPTTMGVLELEAAVQQDPRDAEAWLALGLKQQENEREDAAIRALAKATQLAPDTRPAYLALAVSYVNEGRGDAAHASLEKWIELGSGEPLSQTPGETSEERQSRIVDRLIQIARMSPDDLDADVQIALGVLFNASEDYSKAEDCFLAALEARPDDWVLYNRLGATLANSGRSHEAIKYYHRALALHPNFVRAQFNLGISYINLAQYRLAAQCILDAIRLQHSDVTEGYGAESAGHYTKGVTSDALWTTLRMACLHLQRPDLLTLANHKDLAGFPFEI